LANNILCTIPVYLVHNESKSLEYGTNEDLKCLTITNYMKNVSTFHKNYNLSIKQTAIYISSINKGKSISPYGDIFTVAK
jgi:hypothetical protein